MKTTFLFLLLCAGIAAGCSDVNGHSSRPEGEMFDLSKITVSAQPDHVVTDQSITLTTRAMPRVTGKGRIIIYGSGTSSNHFWILEQPWRDTVRWATENFDPSKDRVFNVEYTANKEFVQQWQVRLTMSEQYSFTFWAGIDSLYVADSNKYYGMKSEVVRQLYPKLFVAYANSGDLFLRP